MRALPASFVRTVGATFGDEGRRWLVALPETLERYAARWGLALGEPFALSYNYVARAALLSGGPCVLKLGVPRDELAREIAALGVYRGNGAVRLLDADAPGGALLLERLLPGRSLQDGWTGDPAEDDGATRTAARLMRGLWRPAPAGECLPLATWAAGLGELRARFGGSSGPLPEPLVARAEGAFADLLGQSPPLLLHGDLHHGNILSARRGGEPSYLAIDPKGVVGDAGYEVGALLRNPAPQVARHPQLKALLARRLAVLSDELGIASHELARWGLAHAVLSAWWDLEDNTGGGAAALACAAALAELAP